MTSEELQVAGEGKTPLRTIFVVEDDEDIGAFLTEALREETPYHTLHASTAGQALEMASSITPSLFLLDYHLPGIDGLELAERLHTLKGLEAIPILLMSANLPSQKVLHQRHIASLAKPFDLADLLKAIDELLVNREE